MAPTQPHGPGSDKVFTSRREVKRLMKQTYTGVGALLLASVDEWNAYASGFNAPLRTALTPLARGTHIAATLAASIEVWLNTPGKHPRGHTTVKPFMWPEVSSRGKVHLVVHHEQMLPTNDRRTAFRQQDTEFLQLLDDPTLCELTWDYDRLTGETVTHIWMSAPLSSGEVWEPFEIPMKAVRAQYDSWSKRSVRWLPIITPAPAPIVVPAASTQPRLPGVSVPPKPGTSAGNGSTS